MDGYVKLFRQLEKWKWYKNLNTKSLFIHCLIRANYEDSEWQDIKIEKGTFITSIKKLADELGLTEKQIRVALNHLKRTNEVATKGASKYTLIKVVNWALYQSDNLEKGEQKGIEVGNQRANKGRTKGDKQEYKELKEEKEKDLKEINVFNIKENVSRFVKPSIEEIKNYCKERNNGIDGEAFWNFYESKGWKIGQTPMKSWKAAVVTWEKKNSVNKPRDPKQAIGEEIGQVF